MNVKVGESMLRLKGLSKYYHDKTQVVQALNNITLLFENNEFVVVTGESGSGKSTLLNVISGLDSYEAGELLVENKETAYYSQSDWEQYRKDNIGFIFQNYHLIESYTVLDNIEVAAFIQGESKASRIKRAYELAKRVGLEGKEKQKASTLSGGEKQRVAIARALAKDAPVLIADEPTGNLDEETSDTILTLLKEIARDRLVIVVSHSFERLKPYATRHIRLHDGEVILDKRLGDRDNTPSPRPEKTEPLGHKGLLRLGLKNLVATPKKSFFTLAIAIFIVGVFASVYGSYVEQAYTMDGFGMSGVSNAHESRLMVTKDDQSAFSSDEIDAMRELNGVIGVAPYDIMNDTNYYVASVDGEISHDYNRGFPKLADTLRAGDLESGRLPENSNEIVVASNTLSVGNTVQFSLEMPRGITGEVTEEWPSFDIVGVIDSPNQWSSEFFFHEDHFSNPYFYGHAILLNHSTLEMSTMIEGEEEILNASAYEMLVDSRIDRDAIYFSENFFVQRGLEPDTFESDITFAYEDGYSFERFETNLTLSTQDFEYQEVVGFRIHPETFSAMFDNYEAYQLTLFVEDAFAAEQVSEAIDAETYNTLYPAGITDQFANVLSVIMNLFMAVAAIVVAAVMYFVAYLALKNVMSAKRKDYIVLRSLGLFKRQLAIINIYEMIAIMLIAIIVTIGFFNISVYIDAIPLGAFIRYYSLSNYLFMIAVLMILSALLSLRFNRNIFAGSVISAFKEQ